MTTSAIVVRHGKPDVTVELELLEGSLPAYAVLLDGVRIGKVYRRTISVERRYKGQRYVSSRRTSKPRYWGYSVPGHRDYSLTRESRKAVLRDVLDAHDEVQERQR